MRITYYAYAVMPARRRILGQLFVTRENGRQISQEWTGVTYSTEAEAQSAMRRLNCAECAQ